MTDFTFTSAQCREYFQSRMPDAKITERESNVVKCPFHEDRTASLSLNYRKGVWNCFAGCGKGGLVAFEEKIKGIGHTEAQEAVRRALNLGNGHSSEKPEAVYTYRDAGSREVFQKLRYPGKRFVIRRKTETGYQTGLGEMEEKPLYCMETLVKSNVVFVVEGERDCDTLNELLKTKVSSSHTYAATCNFDGAGKWRDSYSKYFAGKMVFIVPDNDEPGQKHAVMVAGSLSAYAYQIRIIELKGLPDKGDVSDYLEEHTLDQLFEQIKATPAWKRDATAPTRTFVPALEFISTRQGEDIDWMVDGILERGANGVIVAEPKVGKAQPLDAPVLTPTGWRTMGEIEVDDFVVGLDGRPNRVLAIHPQGIVPCYTVGVSDGVEIETCGEHLWRIYSHDNRARKQPGRLASTLEIKGILDAGKGRDTHIPMVSPVEYPEKALPIAPYSLGYLIGNGCFRGKSLTITTQDRDAAERVGDQCGYASKYSDKWTWGINSTFCVGCLTEMGLWNEKSPDKFIPDAYLRVSVGQRLDLLRGLMDSDGCMESGRILTYSSSSKRLAENVRELVQSLGGTATLRVKPTFYRLKDNSRRQCLDSYIVGIKLSRSLGSPFFCKRKRGMWEASSYGLKKIPSRKIVSVIFSRNVEAQCITVEAQDGLYIAAHHVVTHNSWIAIDLALSLAMGSDFLDYRVRMPIKTALVSREDNPGLTQWRMKHLMRGKHKPQNLDIDQTLMVNTRAQMPQFSLMNDIHMDEVCRALESFRAEICLLDVFKVLHPVDENDNTEMHKVMEKLSLIQNRVGCSIGLVHHSRKAADGSDTSLALRMRGASAIAGWAEWIIGLTRVKSSDEELNIRKFEAISKAAEELDPIHFAIESSEDKSVVVLRRCALQSRETQKEKRAKRILQ